MTDSKEISEDENPISNNENEIKCLDKPLNLSFGINRILGEKRTQRVHSASSSIVHVTSDVDVSDSDEPAHVQRRSQSPTERSGASSPSSPTMQAQKYDTLTMLPSVYPFDLTNTMIPFTGCGVYRGPHGVIKVPAHRAQPVMQLFTPYAIPWVDFRRDRFGGMYILSTFLNA